MTDFVNNTDNFPGKSSMDLSQTVETGHNVIITGQAGTGKSYILKQLYKQLIDMGKNVKITATTGIASTLLPNASTVHSFFGLLDGRFTTPELLHRIKFDDNYHSIKDRICSLDVLMIDEISMLSRRIFEQIEQLCRHVKNRETLFGGIQVVLCGDFLQLKPVANSKYDDPGEYILKSDKFLFHKFELTDIHRQSEETLIRAVHELSRGQEMSKATLDFLTRMKRKLPPGPPPVKLFARNYDVDKNNSDFLMEMEGETKTYRAVDSGDTKELKACPVDQIIHLKEKAKVMLVVNLSAKLVNGLCGTVSKLNDNSVEVQFETIDTSVQITPYKFSIYSREKGLDIACRSQIPLKLAFAMTIHKAQGMTLNRVEIDCRHMRNAGQIGVAVGRASEVKGLRVVNFSRYLVTKHDDCIYEFYSSLFRPIQDDMSCCKGHIIQQESEQLLEGDLDKGESSKVEPHVLISDEGCEVTSSDEDYLAEELIDIDVLDELLNEFDLSTDEVQLENPLPADFNLQTILGDIKFDNPITEEQLQLNKCIEKVNLESLKLFGDVIHNQFKSFFMDTMPEGEGHTVENKHITAFYKKVTLFISDEIYYDLVKKLFASVSPSPVQYRLAFGIVQKVRSIVISKAAEPIVSEAREEARKKIKLVKDSKGSMAKLRYIGGWCVANLRHSKKRLVSSNLYKKSSKDNVNKWDKEIRFLDQLEMRHDAITKEQKDNESMIEIERKQNMQSSLTVINHEAFQFFLDLDKKIQNLETFENLNLYTKSFYHFIFSELKNSTDILEKWRNLFATEDE